MKTQKTTIIAIAATVATAITTTANADIITIDEFESLQMEGFEDMPGGFVRENVSIFDGMGEVFATNGGWIHATSGWGFFSTVRKYEGDKFMGSGSGVTYRFNETQNSFGGFFATNTDVADGTIKFFDNDKLVAQSNINALLGGDWSWNGWTIDQGFTRIEVEGNRNGGGYLMMDSMRIAANTIPAPGALALLLTGGLVISRRRRS